MLKIFVYLIGGTVFAVLFVSQASAYGVETHALLTKEIASFYNIHFSDRRIAEELGIYLIEGSRHEDTNPRYLNHFYDPVHDRGLADEIYKGQGSKYWAQDENSQTALKYKIFARTSDTTLTANQLDKIKPIYNKTNFTWQKAIDLYAQGKTEQALFAVGHIIHLIEDTAVPDHTRNDAHPPHDDGGSPYENWTKKFNLSNPDTNLASKLQTKKPIFLSDLNSYFDSISRYSNNNFYSRDSMSNYINPRYIGILKDNNLPPGYVYGLYKDEDGEFRLILGKSKNTFVWNNFENEDLSNKQLDDLVINDYWSRLSVKSVQHGAGVLDLFFREGEKTKARLALEKSRRPYLGILMDGFAGLFSGNEIVYETPSPSYTSTPIYQPSPSFSPSPPIRPSPTVTPTPSSRTVTVPTPIPRPDFYDENLSGQASPSPSISLTPTPTPVFIVNGGVGFGGGNVSNSTPESDLASSPQATPEPIPESTPTPTPTPTPAPTPTPSFLKALNFYKNPQNEKYYLQLSWNSYPFIPVKFGHIISGKESSHNWRAVVFYYNQDAPLTDDLFWISNNQNASYQAWGLIAPHGLKVIYPNCQGGQTGGSSLILPDSTADCIGLAGNHASFALDINQLEDNNLILEVSDERIFSPSLTGPVPSQDYISLAYYAYQPGYEPNNYGLKLAALDPQKYYFLNNLPGNQPPTKPGSISFEFKDATSQLKIRWDKSADADTLDSLITYKISYNEGQASTSHNLFELSTQPITTYNFEITAVDDLGNKSKPASASYTTPDVPLPYNLTNIRWGLIDAGVSEPLVEIDFASYPFVTGGNPGAMIFFLNQELPADYFFLDDDYRNAGLIGGAHKVLELFYSVCDFDGTWINTVKRGGLTFNNADCPTTPLSILFSALSLARIGNTDTQFITDVSGVISNGQLTDHEFGPDDYITVGFYELGSRDSQGRAFFRNMANYNKKIYFEE